MARAVLPERGDSSLQPQNSKRSVCDINVFKCVYGHVDRSDCWTVLDVRSFTYKKTTVTGNKGLTGSWARAAGPGELTVFS